MTALTFLLGLTIGASGTFAGFLLFGARVSTKTEKLELEVSQLKAQRQEQQRVIVDLQDKNEALMERRVER